MRYLILLFALLVGSVSYAQPADYLISTKDCFLEFSEVRGSDTLVRFNLTLADLTYRNIGDDDIDISSGGDSDDLSIDIDRLPEFATVPLLVAYLDSVRALCTPPPTVGGLSPQVTIDSVIVSIDTTGVFIVDSVTLQVDTTILQIDTIFAVAQIDTVIAIIDTVIAVVADSSTVEFNNDNLDAFSRLRVSNPYTVFDAKQVNDSLPLFFDTEQSGSTVVDYQNDDAETVMIVKANNDYAIRQTKMRFNYQPGKSQLVLTTFNMYGIDANVTKRVGYFNSDTIAPYTGNFDGIYLELSDSAYLCQAKNGTSECVSQANWNRDKLDGTTSSGITLDWDKAQILVQDFQYLGVGRTRHGFDVDGILYYAHEFNNANSKDAVYMQSSNHSIRYEIRSTGGVDSMSQICAAVLSEGGDEPLGLPFSVDVGVNGVSTSASTEIIVGVRLKGGCPSGVIDYYAQNLMELGNDNLYWSVCLNPTYTNAVTWTDVDNTSVQSGRSTGENSVVTDFGHVLASGYIANNQSSGTSELRSSIRIGCSIAGVKDELWLVGRDASGSTSNLFGSLSLQER